MSTVSVPPRARKPWYSILYIQVLIAIAIGILIGHFYPNTGKALKPLGDGFISLIKMMIAPIIFCTVVHGISSMGDLKKVGRVGIKTLFYFEVISTLALVIGLIVGEVLQPGHGFNIDPASIDPKAVATYVTRAKSEGIVKHLMAIIPDTFIGAFAKGDLLQVLLVSILTGFAISQLGAVGERISHGVDMVAKVFFRIIGIIVRVAPIGAFGAMAFTVGAYGVASLWNLIELIGTFYLTSLIFVLFVLGTIARLAGFSILRFIGYIKDELLIVLGTSSSETVLPQLMQKMERLGASRSVVGLVVPTGYSFNLDGTNIYMTLATLFLAQATNTHLGLKPGARHPGHRHDHLEGRLRRHRRRLRDAGGDARHRARYSDPVAGAAARHRQVHERVPGADQSRRQRRRHHRHQPVGRRVGQGQAARNHGASAARSRGSKAGLNGSAHKKTPAARPGFCIVDDANRLRLFAEFAGREVAAVDRLLARNFALP